MNSKVIKKFIGVLLLYFLVAGILQGIIAYLIETLDITNIFLNNILLLISTVFPTFIVLWCSKKGLKEDLSKFKKNWKEYLAAALKMWLKGFGLMIIANLIINLIIMKDIAPNEAANREVLNLFPLYSIISMSILAPLAEETLFRLNLKDIFKSQKKCIFASGILFGLMHVLAIDLSLANLIYLVPYSILGLTFAYIYFKTDCIYSSIAMHALHNTLSILVILLFGA